jgi:AcrR family transcriptional regulator
MSSDTKEKILDTAERLFAEQGFDGTSLRHIIGEAGVNLAAVHYHFHGKEALLDALVLRKLAVVNRDRVAMLDRFEAEAGGAPVALERVLEAFVAPAFAMAAVHPQFLKLMGRVYAEGLMPRLMREHFPSLLERFLVALAGALPGIDRNELAWRMHFMVGAMAHSLRSSPSLGFGGPPPAGTGAEVTRRLVTFLAGGLRAPASGEK